MRLHVLNNAYCVALTFKLASACSMLSCFVATVSINVYTSAALQLPRAPRFSWTNPGSVWHDGKQCLLLQVFHRMRLLLAGLLLLGIAGVSCAPILQANISSLTSNSQPVFVSAINVTSPATNDAIALVIPANTTNYTATPPQKFNWIQSPGADYLTTGTGSVM